MANINKYNAVGTVTILNKGSTVGVKEIPTCAILFPHLVTINAWEDFSLPKNCHSTDHTETRPKFRHKKVNPKIV